MRSGRTETLITLEASLMGKNEGVNSKNLVQQLLKMIPEFQSSYQKLLRYFPEKDVLEYLVTFINATYEYNRTTPVDAEDRAFEDVDDLIGRIMNFVEQVATSGDQSLLKRIKSSFVEHLGKRTSYWNETLGHAGSITRKLMVASAAQNPWWFDPPSLLDEENSGQEIPPFPGTE